MDTNLSQISHKFICEFCNIKTNNKKDYNKHILTLKHKKLANVNIIETFVPKNNNECPIFTCKNCNKELNILSFNDCNIEEIIEEVLNECHREQVYDAYWGFIQGKNVNIEIIGNFPCNHRIILENYF